jgi:type VI secretion system secreted protein Hcp
MDRMSFSRALCSGLLMVACCMAMPASGDDIYFSVEGSQQGKLVGEMQQKGLEGKMRALGFSAGLRVPIDAITGQMTGKRVHEPLRVTREPGRGTVQLMHAMVTSEPLKEVRFDFYAPRIINGIRTMSLYQSIRLTNAKLVGFERTAEAATDLAGGAVRSLEELRFTYEKIELIDVERNVSTQDDWLRPL